jgi:hypothetical protein
VSAGILSGINSDVILAGGQGGASARKGTGGVGGAVSSISGSAGIALFEAGAGGNSASGAGGMGGAVRAINLTTVGQFVRAVEAGDGGDGARAGAGGNVSAISVAGDIGDFTSNFGLTSDTTGMGGIMSGIKGTGAGTATNGSIVKVTADRIAAMLAGSPDANAVGYGNAVQSIAKITASVIGADVNGNGIFDFTEGGGDGTYQPDDSHHPVDGDTALDGFVLVRAGGLGKLPIAPLELIEV